MIPNDSDACVLPILQALQKDFMQIKSGFTKAPLEVDNNNYLHFP